MAYTRRLYKSSDDKIISGVSGGMAEYFDVDPVFFRLGWVVSVFLTGGFSILIYIVMIFVVPRGRHTSPAEAGLVAGENADSLSERSEADMSKRTERRRYLLGIGLVAAGIMLLMYNLDVFDPIRIDWGVVGAVAVVGVGAAIIYAAVRRR